MRQGRCWEIVKCREASPRILHLEAWLDKAVSLRKRCENTTSEQKQPPRQFVAEDKIWSS